MANWKKQLIIFSLLFVTLTFAQIEQDDDVGLKIELDQLKSKISLLESNVEVKIRELKTKDESINQMENIIQEKSDIISSLQNDIQAVNKKGAVNNEEVVSKAQARINELETQVADLRKETEKLSQKRNSLESRASIAEKKVSELNLKLENLKRISDEQKTRIHKTERALQVAEEEMMKAKSRETKVFKKLKEVQQSWVPHWLSIHLFHCQSFILSQWKENGKPMLDATLQQASQKKAQVNKWAEPHIETVKTKWIPVVKNRSTRLFIQIEPHVRLITIKTSKAYYASKESIGPHFVRLQEMVDPYFQEAKKFTKPYVDQVVTLAKPYTKKIARYYKKFLKVITKYHLQLQTAMREILTKPFATENTIWFSASALMAIPVIFLFKLVSRIFRQKPRRRTRNTGRRHNTRSEAKRR